MWNDLEEFGLTLEGLRQMRRVFLDWKPNVVKIPGKSGLEPTAPSRSEDIALYQLSQILYYKTHRWFIGEF